MGYFCAKIGSEKCSNINFLICLEINKVGQSKEIFYIIPTNSQQSQCTKIGQFLFKCIIYMKYPRMTLKFIWTYKISWYAKYKLTEIHFNLNVILVKRYKQNKEEWQFLNAIIEEGIFMGSIHFLSSLLISFLNIVCTHLTGIFLDNEDC